MNALPPSSQGDLQARLDSIERLYDEINGRVTAVNAEVARRAVAGEEAVEAGLRAEAEARARSIADLDPRFLAQTTQSQAAVTRLIALEIRRERDAPRVVRMVSDWLRREESERRAELLEQAAPGEVVQLGRYWRSGEVDLLPVSVEARPLRGLDLAAWALMPPTAAVPGLEFELIDDVGDTMVGGVSEVVADIGTAPLRLRFPAITAADGRIRLRLRGGMSVQGVGLKLYERRRLQPLTRRVRARAWLARPIYA